MIKYSANLMVFSMGETIYCHVFICGYGLDTYVQAALVRFHAKSGHARIARRVFDKMPLWDLVKNILNRFKGVGRCPGLPQAPWC